MSTCERRFRGCLTCEFRMRGGQKKMDTDLHKDPTLPPPADTQTACVLCVPKMCVHYFFFFRHKNKRYTSPATYRSSPKRLRVNTACWNTPFSPCTQTAGKKIRQPLFWASCRLIDMFRLFGAEREKENKKKKKKDCRLFAKRLLLPHDQKAATGSGYDNKQLEFRNVVAAAWISDKWNVWIIQQRWMSVVLIFLLLVSLRFFPLHGRRAALIRITSAGHSNNSKVRMRIRKEPTQTIADWFRWQKQREERNGSRSSHTRRSG